MSPGDIMMSPDKEPFSNGLNQQTNLSQKKPLSKRTSLKMNLHLLNQLTNVRNLEDLFVFRNRNYSKKSHAFNGSDKLRIVSSTCDPGPYASVFVW